MSSLSDLALIGKVLDAHGIRGDIYCIVFSGDTTWISNAKALILNDETFKIHKIKPFKKGFIATLEGFKDRNRAEEFKGAEVRVDASLFKSEEGDDIFLNEIENFKIKDKQLGDIGHITGFSTNGIQDLLVVSHSGGTYEIPFVEDFVNEIDYENEIIYTDLPEGLLEINKPENAKN